MRSPRKRRLAVSAAGRLAGALGCALVAAACVRLGWWVVFDVKIGPVVTTLDAGRGVHTGDVLAMGYLVIGTAFAAAGCNLAHQARRRALVLLALRS